MTFSLVEHGSLEWPQVEKLLAHATCAWADLDGFHIATVPETPPHATHLWACTASSMFRAYIEGSSAIIGELREGGAEGWPTVDVVERQAEPWGDIGRVQPVSPDGQDLRSIASIMFDVRGPRRGTFYRFTDGDQHSSRA